MYSSEIVLCTSKQLFFRYSDRRNKEIRHECVQLFMTVKTITITDSNCLGACLKLPR